MSDFAQTVKQQADIVKVIEGYIRLRKAGAQSYTGLCPFHKEKTPSFSVHAGQQFFYCFGCQASGDVFSFVGQDRECRLSRGGADCGAEVRDSAAQAGVFVAGRGCRSQAADQAAGIARDGRGVV